MRRDGPPPPITPVRGSAFVKKQQVYPKPDYSYWGRLRTWDCIDAAALLCDAEPRSFANHSLNSTYSTDGVVKRCEEFVRLLIDSDVNPTGIYRKNAFHAKSVDYLAWAKRMKIEIAPELEKVVMEFYGQEVVDWEAKYKAQVPLLEAKIEKLEKQSENPNTKELKSLQKLAITLAIEFAKYNPRNIPENLISEIEKASKSFGVGLSDETIRNKLKLAAEMVNKATKAQFEIKGKI